MTNILDTLQSQFGDFFMQLAGNPIFLGVLIVLIFFVWVFIAGMKTDAKLLILVGAFFLAFGLLPGWLQVVAGIVAGLILALAILKVLNR